MKTHLSMLMVLFLSFSLSSCNKDGDGLFCKKPNGNLTTEILSISNFTEIDLANSSQVYIQQGSEFKVEITASDNIIDKIKVQKKGDALEIKQKNGTCIKNSDVFLKVTMPQIEGLFVSGSGKIVVEDAFEGSNLDIDVSGSGNIVFEETTFSKIEIDISGSGRVGFGTGKADKLDVDISGSGSCNAEFLEVQKLDVRISGSGKLDVWVIEEIDAKISGSGSVRYKGDPKVDKDISGSGKVTKI